MTTENQVTNRLQQLLGSHKLGALTLFPVCSDLEDACSIAWSQGSSRMEQRYLALKSLSPKAQFELFYALSLGLTQWRCAQLVKCSPRTVALYAEYCNEIIAGGLLALSILASAPHGTPKEHKRVAQMSQQRPQDHLASGQDGVITPKSPKLGIRPKLDYVPGCQCGKHSVSGIDSSFEPILCPAQTLTLRPSNLGAIMPDLAFAVTTCDTKVNVKPINKALVTASRIPISCRLTAKCIRPPAGTASKSGIRCPREESEDVRIPAFSRLTFNRTFLALCWAQIGIRNDGAKSHKDAIYRTKSRANLALDQLPTKAQSPYAAQLPAAKARGTAQRPICPSARQCTDFAAVTSSLPPLNVSANRATNGLNKPNSEDKVPKIGIRNRIPDFMDKNVISITSFLVLVSFCLKKCFLNTLDAPNSLAPTCSLAELSAAHLRAEEERLQALLLLLRRYRQRYQVQIRRKLQDLQEEGVQGWLVAPQHRQCSGVPRAGARSLGVRAQHPPVFGRLNPIEQQGLNCELLLWQWYEGIGRFVSVALAERLGAVASLRRLSAAQRKRLVGALGQQGPGLKEQAAAPLNLALQDDMTRGSGRGKKAQGQLSGVKAQRPLSGVKAPALHLEQEEEWEQWYARGGKEAECNEAEAEPWSEAMAPHGKGHKGHSYRGFLSHYQLRPLLYKLDWEEPGSKLDSALQQFMQDPSWRRFRKLRQG